MHVESVTDVISKTKRLFLNQSEKLRPDKLIEAMYRVCFAIQLHQIAPLNC